MNGSSIGFAPSTVSTPKEAIVTMLFSLVVGLNLFLDFLFFLAIGVAITRILSTKAITPPSLLGIARKIA